MLSTVVYVTLFVAYLSIMAGFAFSAGWHMYLWMIGGAC